MSEYKFKNLGEIDTVAAPADGTTVMGVENGNPIQMPMSAVKGSGGVFIINPDDPDYSTTDTAYGNKVKEALLSGKILWVYGFLPKSTTTTGGYDASRYRLVNLFYISEDTHGHYCVVYAGDSYQPISFRITVD